jgi:GNAT superfamily N-acetyltransferase
MCNLFSIEIPEIPEISGLVFRRFRGEADLLKIAAVINASLAADKNSERITVEGLSHIFTYPIHWDPQQDTLLVDVNDILIGYANTEWRYEGDGDCLHSINLYLVPQWRGCGLELAMQRYMERCASVVAISDSDGTHWFSSMVPETWQTRVEMLHSLGYLPVRYYFEMQRSLNVDLPEVMMPTGIELRPPLPEQYRVIWEASVECFRDQQDYFVPGEESYRAWIATPDLDPSLWLVAWDGDEIVGAAINTTHEGDWGETDDLFVRRPWCKRGLGRALLVGSLHLFKARGLTTAGLGVDAENASGALALYESIGFRLYQRLVSYRKRV